ncbi:MAG: YdaU family protein [Hyphomicrobium sp.]
MGNILSDQGNFKTRAPWFKCFPTDWREGTRMLSAEHRGIYMDCLCLIYERDAPLPADDKWMAHALHVSVRAWRSARIALLKAGKLTFLQDGWSNSRADEERMKRRSTADQNRIIAQSREDQKREKSKNGNENNETTPPSVPRNEHHAGAFQTSEVRESESDKEVKPASVEPYAEHDGLAGLNGSADLMIADVVGWMHNGDDKCARNWLRGTLAAYGDAVTRNAWAKLKTDMAEGRIIAQPLQTWCKIAERKKFEPHGATAAQPKPSAARAYINSLKPKELVQ